MYETRIDSLEDKMYLIKTKLSHKEKNYLEVFEMYIKNIDIKLNLQNILSLFKNTIKRHNY